VINTSSAITLKLSKNLVKTIKRGHAWVYADALQTLPKVAPGTPAILLDQRGSKEVGRGYYDPDSPIALRICTTEPHARLNKIWAEKTLKKAARLREMLFAPYDQTNAFRLINGEGDGLPGLICDVYDQAAVLYTDGDAAERFYNLQAIGDWLQMVVGVKFVFTKSRSSGITQQISGPELPQPVYFLENGHTFSADLLSGQKTGFFLDQRDNRARITGFVKGRTVLNAFGYTGGFSVYAGRAGASHVFTLDTAQPALEASQNHWMINGLSSEAHTIINHDAFKFLERSAKEQDTWDLVVLDPPSFAPSESAVPQAVNAYTHLFSLGAQVTTQEGILAAASCSSHIPQHLFMEIIEESISRARRKAALIGIYGQPLDHPSPLVMPEMRYLKFALLQLD